MQGSFPIAPRPYEHVAALAEVPEAEVMSRVQRLLDKRIIRQVTPIFDTRALGYSSMLVAAKVDPEHPHRAAQVINEHPGVSHNYLRNHDFNLWFTIATEPDSKLGLEGTLEVLAREAGAESVRQLPTLKLFKIRMDLEMEGDTEALASAVEAKEPIELEPQPYDERDIAVIRALQGDMPVVAEPYAPAAASLGMTQEAFLDHLARHAGARPAAPRRGDPLPPPRRLLGQRHGRLEGARRADRRDRLPDGGRARHLALLPAPDLRGLAVLGLHDGPRPLQGGVRRGARRDRRADRHPRARDALLLDRVQEDPPAVLHGRRSRTGSGSMDRSAREALPACVRSLMASLTDTRSAELTAAPSSCLPGGVNSPVRAMRAIGRDPLFIARGEGAELIDVDGNRFVDYVCSWGPLIHGHAHPDVLAAVAEAAARGTSFGAPTPGEVELARGGVRARWRASRCCA